MPQTLQGEDITPLFANPASSIRNAAFSEIQGRTMVLTGDYKYVHYADGSAELYDVATDPQELTNLAGDPHQHDAEHHLRGLLVEHSLANLPLQAHVNDQPPYRVRAILEREYRAFRNNGGRPEDAPAPSF